MLHVIPLQDVAALGGSAEVKVAAKPKTKVKISSKDVSFLKQHMELSDLAAQKVHNT